MTTTGNFPLLASRRWQRTRNYRGTDLSGYATVYTNGRDALDRANWETACAALLQLDGVEVHSFRDWAVSRFESLMVKLDAPTATLEACEDILQRLATYPCLDEQRLSAVEAEIAEECWDSWGRDELRTAIWDARDGDVAEHVLSNWSDVDLDRLFKASCRDAGVSWYEPIDGDSAQFPINTVAASIASTLASGYAAETAVMIERELADYHRDQLCLPGFDGCMPDVELIGPQVEAWREHALYC